VIVTRQGKGSFVADKADLSTQLRYRELDTHLTAAVSIGRQLGLTTADLASRLEAADTSEGSER
jgi:GntR family transcriptional regulator